MNGVPTGRPDPLPDDETGDGGLPSPMHDAVPMPPAPALAPVRQAGPVPNPAPPATGRAAPGGRVAGKLRVATEAHQGFLARQTETHQRFLDLAGQVRQALISGLSGPAAMPEAPVPAGPAPTTASRALTFDRDQLLIHARGKISELFGPAFAEQDGHLRQTRMPGPPMLLVDRVTALDAVPVSMGTGTIHTQTDVRLDSWYLDGCGRMPAGLLVEAGQACLMLFSWLGADLVTRGERVCRLLGCEITFHGSPPRPGDTLDHTITADGHREHDGKLLFDFHSDCTVAGRPSLSVRGGQAGFFTDAELAGGAGVRWDPARERPRDDGPVDPPPLRCPEDRFDADALTAFTEGRAADCFGDRWRVTRSHVRGPRTDAGRMRLLDEVTDFDPGGGPWQRGYLRATTAVAPHAWFFTGHFRDDPCMPGTLMLQACLQAMAFYLAASGCTIERDGWRFEPVPEQPCLIRCRSQVTPRSTLVAYEVFVSGFSAGPMPTLRADVLCTVDGVAAFHARRLGVRLVPDYPLDHWRSLGPPEVQRTGDPVPLRSLGGLRGHTDTGQVAEVDGHRFGYAAVLASAWGRPADAMGLAGAASDPTRRRPRLPGPPYLFVSRVAAVDARPGEVRPDAWLEAEYDVPEQAWFFDANGTATMPIAALMEVALQPCGLLATYTDCAQGETELFFRNLDGDLTVTAEVGPRTRILRTRVVLRGVTRFADSVLCFFDIRCRAADGDPVFTGTARFGYFPRPALADRTRLATDDEDPAVSPVAAGFPVDFRQRPARYFGGRLRMPGPMLLMLDRITGFWPTGGAAGLGFLRAERDIDAGDWYFRSHFLGDPVQPGSLGMEAMCQLLQFFCIETGLAHGIADPVFEPVMLGRPTGWRFRGQVLPTDGTVTVEAEITEVGERHVRAKAWLRVDGRRIYHVPDLGIGVRDGVSVTPAITELTLDPAIQTWQGDHRPNWTVPVLPMMSIVDIMAGAARESTGREVAALSDVRLRRWLPVTGPTRLRTRARRESGAVAVTLEVWRDAGRLSSFDEVATATVRVGARTPAPAPFPALTDATEEPDPYESGELFHGPAFQYLTALRIGSTGSTAVIDPARGTVPRGNLHQGLLDAITHAVPHVSLWRWANEVARDRIAFPHRIPALTLHEPLPDSGELRVEARFTRFAGDDRNRPEFDLQLCQDDRVLVALRLVEVLLPIGPFARIAPRLRRAFIRDHEYVPELFRSMRRGAATVLTASELAALDWPPGSLGSVYGLPAGARPTDHIGWIAVASHVAHLARIHPRRIVVAADLGSAWTVDDPDHAFRVRVTRSHDQVTVTS